MPGAWRRRFGRWDPASTRPITLFHGGTEGFDSFYFPATAGPDVFCGFGGDDEAAVLEAGDIFLGGEGNDVVISNFGGTFYGGAGNDTVFSGNGTFVQD